MSGTLRVTLAGVLATILASLALLPAFSAPGWLWPGAGAAILVGAVGYGLRNLGTPRILIPLGQLAALGWALIVVYARQDMIWGIFPSGDSVRGLSNQLDIGLQFIVRYAAPVPPDPALVTLTTLGIGLVAVLVDAIAATFRMVPWAGLPLLLLYSIPATTVPGGVSPLAFVPAAIGYILMLVGEGRERLSRWGRVIGFADRVAGPQENVQTSLFGQTGRRVGVAVIGLAVIIPAVMPALPDGVLGSGPGTGTGSSGTVRVVDNPMVDLRRDLHQQENFVVLSYKTDSSRPDYIRLTVLDQFDGEAWRAGKRSLQPLDTSGDGQSFPSPPGVADTVERSSVHTTFDVRPALDSPWLPILYPPKRIAAPRAWSYDPVTEDVVARVSGGSTSGIEYSITSSDIAYDEDGLQKAPPAPAGIAAEYTKLPVTVPASVRDLAKRITRNDKTEYDKAVALQEWFRTNFTYSEDVASGHGGSALLEFLKDRRGYCEQFSATMAIMSRVLGIPARVAVGYQAGTPVGNGRYEVRVKDAHAWPELYFSGYGWVRFEPTPSAHIENPPPWTTPSYDTGNLSHNTPAPQPTRQQNDHGTHTAAPVPNDPNHDGGSTTGAAQGTPIDPVPYLIGLAVLVVLALPASIRILSRRRRLSRRTYAEAAEGGWTELARTVRDLGRSWDEAATPRATGQRLAARLPQSAVDALWVVVTAVERARYAPAAAGARVAGPDIAVATRTVLRGLTARASRRRRVLAFVLPPSMLPSPGTLVRPITWLMDAVETVGGRISGWVRRPRRANS